MGDVSGPVQPIIDIGCGGPGYQSRRVLAAIHRGRIRKKLDLRHTYVYTNQIATPGFEWDKQKNELNRAKHDIDFESAIDVFYGPILLRRSDRNNEERWTALGYVGDRLIVVVFTQRTEIIRVISARRARKNEERDYRNAKMGRPPEGQD
jgi:uncharacterized DUF497 family protein